MADKETLTLMTNIPTTLKLTYDKPMMREGKYGTFAVWGVEHEGVEKVVNFSKEIADQLQQAGVKKGDVIQVTKAEREGEKEKDFIITKGEKTLVDTRKGEKEPPKQEPEFEPYQQGSPEPPSPVESYKGQDPTVLANNLYMLIRGCLGLTIKALQSPELGFKVDMSTPVSMDVIEKIAVSAMISWPKGVPFPTMK